MPKHTPEQVKAAMLVLMTQLRFWDAERDLELLLERDINSDTVSGLCACLGAPEDVTAEDAIRLLDFIKED
jgi:hypothetical protein